MSDKVYLEYRKDGSEKFWSVERVGKKVITRWGRIGTDGQVRIKEFFDVFEAAEHADRAVKEKLRKGYFSPENVMRDLATVSLTGDLREEYEALVRQISPQLEAAMLAAQAATQQVMALSEKYGVPVRAEDFLPPGVATKYGSGGLTYWPKAFERFLTSDDQENGCMPNFPSLKKFYISPYQDYGRDLVWGWVSSSDTC